MIDKDTQTETPQNPPASLESGRAARLSEAQEQEAVQLARELLLAGRASIPAAVEALVNFPWNVGVTAVTSTWPELKPESQKQVISLLAEQPSDTAKRLRLSIARGLFGIDPAAVESMVTDLCTEMRAPGALTPKDRQTFANVFIGKGKPWVQNLPIESWAQPEPLVAAAIDACFSAPCAPFTQLGLVRWLATSGQLAKLDEATLTLIAKAVKRWSSRFRTELKKDVPELPAILAEALSAPEPAREQPNTETTEPVAAPENEERRAGTDSALERMVASTRGERSAPSRERRESSSSQAFDLATALRQIESHVTSLRKELHDARGMLRQREGGGGRGRSSRREAPAADESRSPDVESLQRHNAQLEEMVAELRQRLEDLASDHEDRAAASNAHESDSRAQLTELLGLKLRESFAEFQALRGNSADEVVRQHFGDMLEAVFGVLEEQGVALR